MHNADYYYTTYSNISVKTTKESTSQLNAHYEETTLSMSPETRVIYKNNICTLTQFNELLENEKILEKKIKRFIEKKKH